MGWYLLRDIIFTTHNFFRLKIYFLGICLLLAGNMKTEALIPSLVDILDRHSLYAGPLTLPAVSHDASGITWSELTGSLFVVRNDDPMIFELDGQGNVLRNIPMLGFYDVEGITWVNNNFFAVVEERTCTVWLLEIGSDTTSIIKPQIPFFTMPALNASLGNNGCEDIAWNAAENVLYLIKEKSPALLLRISGLDSSLKQQGLLALQEIYSDTSMDVFGSDVSGLYFDMGSGQLLVLSDESQCITGITTYSKAIEAPRFGLGWFSNGLLKGIPQPEGVTMDDAGNLYVLSEPNQLYRFSR